MGPYRVSGDEGHAEAPADAGIVGEVIAQFADTFAFLRELVQNAIDAGTATVDVQISWDGALNRLRVSVRDRGSGMTRDVLENQLLVLFRSTKERDRTKIGKFGIGFASVLAPNPVVVVVDTVAAALPPGERRRLSLHLARDLTYRLFDAGPATQPGTVVELELAMPQAEVESFVQRSIAALVRWCRHVSVPIHVHAQLPDGTSTRARIDRPLGLDDVLVEVREEADAGQLVIVLGVPASGMPSVGFFNHGLMLFETAEPLVGPYACKIQDSRLGHTLSRDNVRRDRAFDHAVERARALVPALHAAIARALRTTAEQPDAVDYLRLVGAIVQAGVALAAQDWVVPLVDAVVIDGQGEPQRAARPGSSGGWVAPSSSPVTRCLAQHGIPVRRAHVGPPDATCVDADAALAVVTPLAELTPQQLLLVSELGATFEAAGRAPRRIELADVDGALASEIAIAADPDDAVHPVADAAQPYALMRGRALRSPFARLRRAPLILNARHATVRAASLAGDPRVAASHLARLLLLRYELLDEDRSERILAQALAQLGVNPGGES